MSHSDEWPWLGRGPAAGYHCRHEAKPGGRFLIVELWVLVLLAGAPAGLDLRLPRVTASTAVPDELRALGFAVRLEAYRSEAAPEQLFEHVLRELKARGLFVPAPGAQPQLPGTITVTGVDGEAAIAHTIILVPAADGSTTVVVGQTDLSERQLPEADGLPIHPLAVAPLRTTGEGFIALAYEAKAPVAEVKSFHSAALQAAGYTAVSERVYTRGGEELQLFLTPRGEATSVVVLQLRAAPR